MTKTSNQLKHEARKVAVQALYAWGLSQRNVMASMQDTLSEMQQLLPSEALSQPFCDMTYLQSVLNGIAAHVDTLEETYLIPYASHPWHTVSPILKAILWLGSYELVYRLDVPFKVVLNEAVELSKVFGAEDAHKFINSILDKVAKQVRQSER